MKRVTLALLALILLTACAPQVADTAVPASTATLTPTATVMPTATPTMPPTATASPTPTATPAVISLPVRNGTPVPDLPYEVITAENVHRLREVARYGYPRLLEGHPCRLTADGKTIVVGTTAGIEFYDALTHAKNGGFEVEFLRAFDMSPDGRFILTRAGDTLTVWRQDGKKVREFALEAGDAWALNAVAISPNGSLLAVQRPRGQVVEPDKVDVYRVEDGSLVDTVRGMGAQFSPDGKYLATVFDASVRLYPVAELGTGWEKRLPGETLPWCGGGETCGLTFSPDGTLAAVVRAGRVDVYQVETRKLVRQVSGWEEARYKVPLVSFTKDNQLVLIVTANPDFGWKFGVTNPYATAILVNISSGEWISEVPAPEGFVYPSEKEISMFSWKPEGEMPYFDNPVFLIDNKDVKIAEGVGNELWTCGVDGCKKETLDTSVSLDENLTQYRIEKHENRWVVISPNGEQIVSFTSPTDEINVLIFNGNVAVVYFQQSLMSVVVKAFRSDGKQTVISGDYARIVSYRYPYLVFEVFFEKAIKVLNLEDWTVQKFNTNWIPVGMDNSKLFFANHDWQNPSVWVWDLSSKEKYSMPVQDWKIGRSGETSASSILLPYSELLFVDSSGFVFVFDLRTRKYLGEFIFSHPAPVEKFVVSDDGRLLMSFAYDGFIRVWAVVPEDAPVR